MSGHGLLHEIVPWEPTTASKLKDLHTLAFHLVQYLAPVFLLHRDKVLIGVDEADGGRRWTKL